jgi:hypothetical protein
MTNSGFISYSQPVLRFVRARPVFVNYDSADICQIILSCLNIIHRSTFCQPYIPLSFAKAIMFAVLFCVCLLLLLFTVCIVLWLGFNTTPVMIFHDWFCTHIIHSCLDIIHRDFEVGNIKRTLSYPTP